jgi:hypothetical protein
MTNIDYIVESMNKENARTKILELMAGSADGNYEVCLEQFAKTIKKRVLKEESGLNLNQVMELNQLVELVASKLNANQQQCLEGIYNIISQKAGVNAAKTFIGMVQQSSVNQSSLKFNTDLVVDGKNLAQVIYALKNEIEIFCNSIKKEESEKDEVKESVDGYSIMDRKAGILDINTKEIQELGKGEEHNMTLQDYMNGKVRFGFQPTQNLGMVCYITAADRGYAYNARRIIARKYPNIIVDTWNLEFRTDDGQRMFIKLDSNGKQIFENKNVQHFTSEDIHQMMMTESYESYKHIIQELDKAVDDVSDINILKSIADRVDTLLGRVKNMNEANEIASLKTAIETKMNSLLDVKPALDECCLATQVAQDVCGEDTFNGLLDSVKPTVINITVNKEDNGILPCVDNCCAEPCCDCNDNCCCEPCCDCNDNCCCEPCCDCGDDCAAPIVQPMNFEPTAIDAPILRKPNSAEVTSAITALSSHTNDIKSDSRENNLENLQTINTLLGQISNYFNTLLGESFDIGDKITNKKGLNDEVMEITDKYEENGREVYDVKVDLGNGIKTVSKGLDAKDLEDKNEKIEGLWDGEEDEENEQLDEETVYDHSWFEVEGQKYPKRTKNGVEGLPIKETCSAGACCAASVATVPSKPKKAKSKPRKQESFDVSLFKESVRNDCPATLTINDKKVSYKLVEGKGYLYIDNGIVKTLDKDVMLETIDDVYNNCLDIEILEGFNAYELNILLEDGINDDMGDIDSVTTITPEEKKEAQTELDNNLAQKPNSKINVVSSENSGEIHQNQEFVGIDDHDESNKKYIVKDPATGKITVADYNQIKIAEN